MAALAELPRRGRAPALSPGERERTLAWLENLLTGRDLRVMFGVSDLTIQTWRRELSLPCIRIPGAAKDAVRYERAEVTGWAGKTGKRILVRV